MTFYVAHRLFAAHDRALAADLADRLAKKVGADRVFLPFCDTDEEDLVAEVKGRRLFELDRDRLGRLDAMIAILHGPSLDDGVCMEIGYAIASGVPVVVLTTDFQTYSMTEAGTRLEFPDPLLQAVATRIVRVAALGPLPLPPGQSRFQDFQARNAAQTTTALDTAVDALLDLPDRAPLPTGSSATTGTAIYVEPSPYLPRHRDHLAESLAVGGHTVVEPQRFTASDPVVGALADLAAVRSAARVLADVSGPETPPGAALLIGAALASGVPVAAFHPYPTFTHAHGREPNWRNLMIQYAVDAHFSSDKAVLSWLAA
ncbi:nucleoside 2-deoxyribosyltransferase [Streptomyces goshikiensis]|uniref:nucleoside 2-deoxyribosyltransferase n=1 Tax=Streptomyces goshikiensis TaxID=1942 RepID=UPI00364E07F2